MCKYVHTLLVETGIFGRFLAYFPGLLVASQRNVCMDWNQVLLTKWARLERIDSWYLFTIPVHFSSPQEQVKSRQENEWMMHAANKTLSERLVLISRRNCIVLLLDEIRVYIHYVKKIHAETGSFNSPLFHTTTSTTFWHLKKIRNYDKTISSLYALGGIHEQYMWIRHGKYLVQVNWLDYMEIIKQALKFFFQWKIRGKHAKNFCPEM